MMNELYVYTMVFTW